MYYLINFKENSFIFYQYNYDVPPFFISAIICSRRSLSKIKWFFCVIWRRTYFRDLWAIHDCRILLEFFMLSHMLYNTQTNYTTIHIVCINILKVAEPLVRPYRSEKREIINLSFALSRLFE